DTYHVFNIIQCDMSGGNVVAIDSGGSPINPILPTAFTQVVRTSSSSSTLTSQTLLEFSSYQNAAWIDTTNGSAGTAFPLGTRESPTNNIDDAKAIAGAIGSANIGVLGTLTLASGDDVTGCNLIGENHLLTSVTLDPGCNTTNTRFTDMSISGTYGGQSITSGCRLSSLSAMQGTFDHCQFEVGTHVLDNSSLTKILDCYSLGLNTFPTFDYNVTGANLIVRSWNGPANLINKTGVDFVCIDINSGIWVFDNTVNGTNISVRGVGKINSTASPAINDFVGSIENIAAAVWEEPVPGTRTAGTYSEHVIDDLLTVFKFNALK
ncbi:MAG: hypothetical protein KAJ03_07965, partial [Gammaproteobacteria bacterium]|nr:hypothetical protein [Gammaproteobacteria bacterium]